MLFEQLLKLKRAVLTSDNDVEIEPRQQQTALVVKQETPFDGVDLLSLILGVGFLYEIGTPVFFLLAVVQYIARRVRGSAEWLAEAVYGVDYKNNARARLLFPGVRIEDVPPENIVESFVETPNVLPSSVHANDWTTETAIRALPPLVLLDKLTIPDSTTAVPLGVNHNNQEVWADFMVDLLHVGIYGTSGAGKDTLLRVWFATVASRSQPEDVQWVFLDGKGDWLTPDLADLACMYAPPAGGYGQRGKDAILKAIKVVDAEAERRQGLIFPSGCRTREQYNKLATAEGRERIPLLVVVASDVMDSVAGEVEELLASLVSKARALGIRVVASMQTPTGKSMGWRMNLSSVLAGALVDGSQDAPALGVREMKDLPFRPSRVPPPPKTKGVFVARVRGEFMVLRTPTFCSDADASEEHFNQIVAALPKKSSHVVGVLSEERATDDRDQRLELDTQGVNRFEVGNSGNRVSGAEVSAGNSETGNQFPPHRKATFQVSSRPVYSPIEAANLWKEATDEEKRKVVNSLQMMRSGLGKQAAIIQAFGYSSGRNYQRASELVEAAKVLVAMVSRKEKV